MQKVDRKLWLDAEGNLVEDGDPDAAILWHTPGDEITDEEADAVGYKDGEEIPDDEPDTGSGLTITDAQDDEVKEADKPEDKAVAAPEADKAKGPAKKATKKASPRKRA